MNSVPIPSHTPFLPTEEPPDSTTGVLKLGFLPNCSAIILANGNTVDDPAKLRVSLAWAALDNTNPETTVAIIKVFFIITP